MAKRYDEPIEVTPDPAQGGAPLSFNWRGRRYEVDQWLMNWREAGEWWRRRSSNGNGSNGSSEANGNGAHGANANGERNGAAHNGTEIQAKEKTVRERLFFRVLARPSGTFATGELDADGFMEHAGGVYDIYIDLINKQWRIARIWD